MEEYTFAQINILIIAKAEDHRRTEKRQKRNPKRERPEREKVKPAKPFKDMTGEEYMEWVNMRSGGKF